MVDRIKELGKVDIHGNTVALLQIRPHLAYRLMRTATGTKTET